MVAMVIFGLLAAGFFSVLTSARYLVSRSKHRLAAYEEARRQIEWRRSWVRADAWYQPAYQLVMNGTWTAWGNATVVNGVNYQSRYRVDKVINDSWAVACTNCTGGADCPRVITMQVRWNETRL